MKLSQIFAIVAIVLLAAVFVGGLWLTGSVAWNAGAWPVLLFLGVMLFFGWDNIVGTFKWLLNKALGK